MLGFCRGLQMIASFYGAELTRSVGHVATLHAVALEDEGPLVLQSRTSVNSFHDWSLKREALCNGLAVSATAPDGTVEALYHREYRQAAVMWHPERSPCDTRDVELMKQLFGDRTP